jgi:hypothetical protein
VTPTIERLVTVTGSEGQHEGAALTNRPSVFGMTIALVTLCGANANAQQSIKILTPTNDTCAAFIQAMEDNDKPAQTAGLAGWALGFFSGVAQGTGKDILRNAQTPDLIQKLYLLCKSDPYRPLSVAAEHMAQSLVAHPAAP